jgi:iron(III) transport system ATP-binding protein
MKPPATSGRAAVVLDQVVKRYGRQGPAAVDGVSLTFEAGTLTTLLGPSGCGKTTTLRMIAGLETVTQGQIHIGGRDVTQLPATERDVSMVFQSYALFPHMRVMDNIRYGLEVSGVAKDDQAKRVQEVMALMGLSALGQRYPHELSGGQQQRVAVARALVLEPQVLLFDEPLSNLDAKLRRSVRQEIRELQQSLGLTVIYVTHDQEEALAVSDTIVVMNNAVVAQSGSPRDLYERPASRFVADFMGEANVLPVQIESAAVGGFAEVSLGTWRFRAACPDGLSGDRLLAVRPSRIEPRPPNGADTTGLPGTVVKASYLGDVMEYLVETTQGSVLVTHAQTRSPWAVGEAVVLHWGGEQSSVLPEAG